MITFVYFLIYFYIFILGACVGSFLNVVIYRLPNEISFCRGRSACPKCGIKIKAYDLVPVFSFLFLGGKCRSCRTKISYRYPLIELSCGFFALVSVLRFGFNQTAIFAFLFVSILVLVTMIDFDTSTIPNSLIISLIPLSILSVFILEGSLSSKIIGFFIISLPMYFLCFFVKDAFGGGDIKLIAVCGFILGFKNTLLAFFISLILASLYIFYLLLNKKIKRTDHIPFGPYFCAGIYISFLFGNEIILWYLGLFGF